MELTIEQKRAQALAAARQRAAQTSAPASSSPAPAADAPPPGAVPGSREYADWAASQARAGKTLPQVSPTPPESTAQPSNPSDGMGKFTAAYTSAVNDIPIAGPTLLKAVEGLRANYQGMTPEQVAAEGSTARDANPITSKTSGVASTIASLYALSRIPGFSTLLGMTGGMPSQVILGGTSSALIGGLDAKARGANNQGAMDAALLGGGLGALAPIAGALLKGGFNAVTGSGAPKEAAILARAMRDDQIAPQAAAAKLADMGDGAMLMDLGPNLQSQAGALASIPGNAQKVVRDAVAARGAQASDRVTQDVAQTIGFGPEITALKEQTVAAQKAAADPLYQSIRDLPVQPTSLITAILNRPSGQKAFEEAIRLAADDGYRFPTNGNVLTVGVLDYVKRALDDMAGAAVKLGKGNDARGPAGLARALRSAVDQQVPAYKAARDAFAGPAQVLEAVDEGAKAFTKDMSPAQLNSMLKGMSASERDGFLAGAQSSVEAMMGNAVNDPLALRNMFKKGWNEAKLRILLGDDVAADLIKRMDREAAFGTTSNVVSRNSETARRLAAQGEVAPEIGSVGQVTALGLVFGAINKARAGLRDVVQPGVNKRLAAALSSGSGQLDPALLEQVRRASMPKVNAIAPAAASMQLTGPQ